MRLNTDGRGRLLGEFQGDDKIIVFTSKGQYYTTGYDTGHHFPEDTIRVEKYAPDRIYSVAYYDADSRYYYLKRFAAEASDNRMQSFIDDSNPRSRMTALSADRYPQLEITYGGAHRTRPADLVDVEQFIGVKSHRAKGKRLTTPTRHPQATGTERQMTQRTTCRTRRPHRRKAVTRKTMRPKTGSSRRFQIPQAGRRSRRPPTPTAMTGNRMPCRTATGVSAAPP